MSGIGLLFLIPHLFVLQILWKNLFYPIKKSTRIYFIFSLLISVCALFFINFQFEKALIAIDRFQKSKETILEKSYFTEKILGMHLIYHTKICLYDGWRPPIHEPMLVLSLWMNKNIDPLPVSLKQRHFLYKKFFPENAIKQKCSCAISYSQDYFNDPLWN